MGRVVRLEVRLLRSVLAALASSRRGVDDGETKLVQPLRDVREQIPIGSGQIVIDGDRRLALWKTQLPLASAQRVADLDRGIMPAHEASCSPHDTGGDDRFHVTLAVGGTPERLPVVGYAQMSERTGSREQIDQMPKVEDRVVDGRRGQHDQLRVANDL